MKPKTAYNLFRIVVAGIFLLVIPLFIIQYGWWNSITRLYVVCASLFLLYRFTAWFFSELSPLRVYPPLHEPYSIIIPVKDEDPELLLRVVHMAVAQKGRKEVIIGDDGSKVPVSEILKERPDLYERVIVYRSSQNLGKKHLQSVLFRRAKNDLLINIDSDILLDDPHAVQRLIAPLRNRKVGITNGNVEIISPKRSLLTRIQSIMYYGANQVGRKSWGTLGLNPCASGEILAIRKSQFMPFLNEYLYRTFSGIRLTFGEDRLMTNLLLRAGYKSVYVETAKAATPGCETFPKYIKQQTRWRRSGIHESIFFLGFSRNAYLITLISLTMILPLVFTILLTTTITYYIMIGAYFYFIPLFGILVFVNLLADIPMLFEKINRFPDLILFSLFNVFILSPLWIYALFTLDRTGWGTR